MRCFFTLQDTSNCFKKFFIISFEKTDAILPLNEALANIQITYKYHILPNLIIRTNLTMFPFLCICQLKREFHRAEAEKQIISNYILHCHLICFFTQFHYMNNLDYVSTKARYKHKNVTPIFTLLT